MDVLIPVVALWFLARQHFQSLELILIRLLFENSPPGGFPLRSDLLGLLLQTFQEVYVLFMFVPSLHSCGYSSNSAGRLGSQRTEAITARLRYICLKFD